MVISLLLPFKHERHPFIITPQVDNHASEIQPVSHCTHFKLENPLLHINMDNTSPSFNMLSVRNGARLKGDHHCCKNNTSSTPNHSEINK